MNISNRSRKPSGVPVGSGVVDHGIEENRARRTGVVGVSEGQQLDCAGVPRVNAAVHAAGMGVAPTGALWPRIDFGSAPSMLLLRRPDSL